jgi:hypothetical protein
MDKKSANQLESILEKWFKQLPSLPPNGVNALVSITPWLALIFGILGVLGAISAFGILSFLAPLAVLPNASPSYGLGMVTTIGWLASSVMMLLAFPGLKAGKANGWNMLFWSEVVNAVTSVVGISIGSVVGAAIAFYLLFQIKPKYKTN